jgi:hypothetical protein
MRQASKRIPDSAEKTVRDIRRATRRRSKARSGSPAIGRTGRAEQQRCRRKARAKRRLLAQSVRE